MLPLSHKIYPLDSEKLVALKAETRKLLTSKRIRPSDSPYGAPILFAKKKDSGLLMCVNYCVLNKKTIIDSYLLPCIYEMLYHLKRAKNFLSLDLRDKYH